jgi:hypothetical protein
MHVCECVRGVVLAFIIVKEKKRRVAFFRNKENKTDKPKTKEGIEDTFLSC